MLGFLMQEKVENAPRPEYLHVVHSGLDRTDKPRVTMEHHRYQIAVRNEHKNIWKGLEGINGVGDDFQLSMPFLYVTAISRII